MSTCGRRRNHVDGMSYLAPWLFYAAAVVVFLVGANRGASLRGRPRAVLTTIVGASAVWLSIAPLRTVVSNLKAPREWDFVCFWLWGRMGALHLEFYDPAKGIALGRQMGVSDEMVRDILSVGFWYPPPTMLLFAPLGLLEMKAALLVWYLVQGAFAIATVVLLARLFLRDLGALGIAVSAGLVALLPSARSTVWFAQTNFMALTLFLLLYRDRERTRAGLWVALGALVKPYFVFFLAYLLLKRAYRTLALATLCLTSAVVISTLSFGLSPMLSFLRENPSARVPAYIYGEPMNQSLLGTLLRFSTGALDGSLLRQPLYIGLALIIVVASAWIVHRQGDDRLGRGELATLLVALLLYPGTLAHYSLLLLAPLLALWRDRKAFPGQAWGAVLALAVVYAILGWDRFETYNFWANLTVWATSIFCWSRELAWTRRYEAASSPPSYG
jgi:hypothetical protein